MGIAYCIFLLCQSYFHYQNSLHIWIACSVLPLSERPIELSPSHKALGQQAGHTHPLYEQRKKAKLLKIKYYFIESIFYNLEENAMFTMIPSKMLLTGRKANLILLQYAVYSQEVQKREIDRKFSNILFYVASTVISFSRSWSLGFSRWNVQSIIGPDFITESSDVCTWGIW